MGRRHHSERAKILLDVAFILTIPFILALVAFTAPSGTPTGFATADAPFSIATAPTIASVILNTSGAPSNGSHLNLTVFVIGAADVDGDPVQNITDWRKANSTGGFQSIMRLNMPFETNVSSTAAGAIRDYSTFQSNGTLGAGSSTRAPAWTSSGRVGGAYIFDQIDDFINLSKGTFDFNGAYAIEVWFKPRTNSTSLETVVAAVQDDAAVNAGTIEWGCSGLPQNVRFLHRRSGGTDNICSASTFPLNSWMHAVGTFDVGQSPRTRLYVNGVLEASGSSGAAGAITVDYLTVGMLRATGFPDDRFFNGTIDEVRIYNRSLSAAQIRQLYLDGNASRHPMTMVSQEIDRGDVWQVAVTPNDNQPNTDGTTVSSNNLTVTNGHPSIAQVTLTKSGPSIANENLTVSIVNATDPDGDAVQNITDWRRNGVSISVLNMPFESNISSTATNAIRDYSTFQNNGTLGNGTAAQVPVWNSSGRVGGAYVFDGINDIIEIADSSSLQTQEVSVGAWIRPSAYPSVHSTIVQKSHNAPACNWNSYYLILLSTGKIQFAVQNVDLGDFPTWETIDTIPLDQWSQVTATFKTKHYNASDGNIYVNGTSVSTTFTANGYSSGFTIGYSSPCRLGIGDFVLDTFARPFSGPIDEVSVFSRSLSAAQIRQLYLDGNASRHLSTIVSNETSAGEVWSVTVTPNDNQPNTDGDSVSSNNVTVGNANLVASDETDTVTQYSGDSITFYADYANASSGVDILGASCNASFAVDSSTQAMTYSAGAGAYTTTKAYSAAGTTNWNATCGGVTNFATITANDTVTITAIGVPEFSTWTLLIALAGVMVGFFVIRSRV